MAHPCRKCDNECYCHGDVSAIVSSKTPKDCESCGCEEWDDLEEDMEPIGYTCLACGNEQDFGGVCNRCTGYCMEPLYM